MSDVTPLRYPSSVALTSPTEVVDGRTTVPVNVGPFRFALLVPRLVTVVYRLD